MNLRTEPLSARTAKRPVFPIAAGILTIIAACFMVIVGIFGLAGFAYEAFKNNYDINTYYLLFVGLFGILGFAFGLTGGIFSLKRSHFAMSMVGVCLLVVSGFVVTASIAAEGGNAAARNLGGWLFGLLIILLSILCIIFLAISKGEFD